MAVYREGYSILEMINSNAQAVFNDACDLGAPVEKGDALWYGIKQLYEWYGEEGSKKRETGWSYSFVVELMDEWAVSDKRKTEEEAIDRYKVTYTLMEPWINKPYLNGIFRGAHGFVNIEKM